MPEWLAPAKLNLDLRIAPPEANGMHPLRSLVQTIEWSDRLTVEEGDEDALEVEGANLPDDEENLVWKAVRALELGPRPRLHVRLQKAIPVAAGLGGGSSDAAAALMAVTDLLGRGAERVQAVAPSVGSDVPFFLVGGTAWMEGYGERLLVADTLEGFSVGVAVAPFEMSTAEVYRRWDQLEGPVGEETPARYLPPPLRAVDEVRNDLVPAAIDLRPELADWMSDLADLWERPVFMSGSGPACFAYFVDEDEAASAIAEVTGGRGARAANLRRGGVERLD